jgi:hypothetical protein
VRGHLTFALTVGRDIHLPENTTGDGGRTFNAIQSGRSIFEKAQDRPDLVTDKIWGSVFADDLTVFARDNDELRKVL